MTRRRLLCILYLSIWLVYGFAYWITANVTNGEAFVFNSDLLLNIHIDKISKELGYDFPKKYLKEIIVNDLKCYYSHDFVSFNPIYLMQGMSKSKCSIPISILTTYELINDGATHFKISKYIDNTKESKLFFQFIKSYEIKGVFYYVIETHYKKNKKPFSFIINTEAPLEQLSIFTPESKDSKTKTKTIFVGNAIANKEAIDIDKLPNILVNSYCIPFITTLRLTQISSIVNDNNYTFPLLDFLYFSAITITTVGYGDILPNCTLIRVLVMTEVFFGTIIIGVFISTLIKKNDTVS